MDRDLLLALPLALPEHQQAEARAFVDQVLAALDLVSLPVDLEAVLGAWRAVVLTGDRYPVLAELLEAAGERPVTSRRAAWDVLDALERLADFEATTGVGVA